MIPDSIIAGCDLLIQCKAFCSEPCFGFILGTRKKVYILTNKVIIKSLLNYKEQLLHTLITKTVRHKNYKQENTTICLCTVKNASITICMWHKAHFSLYNTHKKVFSDKKCIMIHNGKAILLVLITLSWFLLGINCTSEIHRIFWKMLINSLLEM